MTPETDGLIPLLDVGATLLDRYAVRAVEEHAPERNVYRVAEAQVCPLCGVENSGSATLCGFCQNPLPPVTELVLVEQRLPTLLASLPPSSFIANGHLYTLAHAGADAAPRLPLPAPTFAALTDAGIQRGMRGDPNEDAALALALTTLAHGSPLSFGLFAVADGVGGAAAGEVASRTAVDALAWEVHVRLLAPLLAGSSLDDDSLRAELAESVRAVNTRLLEYGRQHQLTFGTTLSLALVVDTRLLLVNVGDSRAYRLRDHALEQLTHDHSYIAALIERGEALPEEIYTHPQRNVILKALGDPTGYEFDVLPLEGGVSAVQPGDQLLLCSDGLWEMVRDPEIARTLAQAAEPREACARLVAQANAAGGADNVTAVVVRF